MSITELEHKTIACFEAGLELTVEMLKSRLDFTPDAEHALYLLLLLSVYL